MSWITRMSLVFVVCLLAGCGRQPEAAPTGPPPVLLPVEYEWVSPARVRELLRDTSGIGVIDVREDSERNDGRGTLPGAQALPFSQDIKKQLASMDRNRPWLVYCAIGARSELFAQTMARLGFKRVYLLRGGFEAWHSDG